MKKATRERLKKIAVELGYTYEELAVKGIEAMLEWIEEKDAKRIPKFLLAVKQKRFALKKAKKKFSGD